MNHQPSKLIRAIANHDPKSLAIIDGEISLTYEKLFWEIANAVSLIKNYGNIGLMAKNSAAWVIIDLAAVAAGVTLIPIPYFFSDEQIRHVISDSKINTILTDEPEKFSGNQAEDFLVGEKLISKISLCSPNVLEKTNVAKITYTSGTTGSPKGVCLTQTAIETVADSLLKTLGANISKRHLALLPFGVLLENIAGIYTTLLAGATLFISNTSYEPQNLSEIISHSKAQSCILVPELLKIFLYLPCDFSQFSYVAVGGASVSKDLLLEAEKRKLPVFQGYGLSECASVVSINTPKNNRVGSVGKLLPHIKLNIADDGEIIILQPLFLGYLGSEKNLVHPFPTGDIGHLDSDGYLYISGRKKNIFITSFGRNISPEWLESELLGKSEILQAAVFGEARPFPTAIIFTKNPNAAALQIKELNQILPEYAEIKSYIFAPEPFSTKNGQLTGNGKLRRQTIFQKYQQQLHENIL